ALPSARTRSARSVSIVMSRTLLRAADPGAIWTACRRPSTNHAPTVATTSTTAATTARHAPRGAFADLIRSDAAAARCLLFKPPSFYVFAEGRPRLSRAAGDFV